MWKTGGPVFPPNRGWWQEEHPTVKQMPCYKNADYLLWRPLIGNKPKDKEERRFFYKCTHHQKSAQDISNLFQCSISYFHSHFAAIFYNGSPESNISNRSGPRTLKDWEALPLSRIFCSENIIPQSRLMYLK